MVSLKSTWLALLGGALLAAAPALAQDSGPLLDLLVKKGVVTDQEAEDLRAELTRDFAANTAAGKMNLSSPLTEFKLSGDVRIRHQHESQKPALASGSNPITNERIRERFRFRFNGDMLLQKGWSAGFALETADAADSGNQTFENGNNDYGIFLARAYVGWQMNRNFGFVLGKQRNPIYASDLRWDADINPQGASEIYKLALAGKDTLEFRALQNIFDDSNESAAGPNGRDAWLFEQQAVYTHWFGRDSIGNVVNSFILAPGFAKYNEAVLSGVNNETAFNGTTRYLSLATFAGEVNFANVNGVTGNSVKLYWDSSYNLEAGSRVSRAYGLNTAVWDEDPLAWLIGAQYAKGTGRVQGDYSIRIDYRQVGLGAVDVNTNDSDFAFGRLNQEGWKAAVSYNLTDFANLNVTYFRTTAMQENLTHTLANLESSNLLQVDLVVKY